MSDALKRIEKKHHAPTPSEAKYADLCPACDQLWPCDVLKLARALDYYREHYDDGRVATLVLEEVAGDSEQKG